MLKITLEVEGMRCGMCETHVNDVVRRMDGVNIELIKEAIAKQGYGVGRIETEPYVKRGLFSRKR